MPWECCSHLLRRVWSNVANITSSFKMNVPCTAENQASPVRQQPSFRATIEFCQARQMRRVLQLESEIRGHRRLGLTCSNLGGSSSRTLIRIILYSALKHSYLNLNDSTTWIRTRNRFGSYLINSKRRCFCGVPSELTLRTDLKR